MIRLRNINLDKFFITIVLLYSIMPIISRAVSVYLTTYSYLFVVALIVLGCVFRDINEHLNVILPFVALGFISLIDNNKGVFLWGYQLLLNILPILIAYYLLFENKESKRYYLVIISLAYIITCITTIRGLILHPSASRILATEYDTPMKVVYNWLNIGGFDFVYSLVLIYPVIIYAFKRGKINLFTTLTCTVLFGYTVISSEYAIALILFIISTILFFFNKNIKASHLVALFLILFLLFIVMWEKINNYIILLGDVLGSDTLSMRLDALAGGVEGINNSDDKRLLLYMRSLTTFFSRPFTGTALWGSWGVGGHSFILDHLAKYGIVGGCVVFAMFRKLYNYFYRIYSNEAGYGFVVWIFLQGVILSLINPGFWYFILGLIIPMLLYWINMESITESEVTMDECSLGM